MASNFKIGSTNPPTALDALATPLDDPRSTFAHWAQSTRLANGGQRGAGKPSVTWTWALLTQAERDMLRTFCSGASAAVYITTRQRDGTFATYIADMLWQQNEPSYDFLKFPNFQLTFRNLIALIVRVTTTGDRRVTTTGDVRRVIS